MVDASRDDVRKKKMGTKNSGSMRPPYQIEYIKNLRAQPCAAMPVHGTCACGTDTNTEGTQHKKCMQEVFATQAPVLQIVCDDACDGACSRAHFACVNIGANFATLADTADTRPEHVHVYMLLLHLPGLVLSVSFRDAPPPMVVSVCL